MTGRRLENTHARKNRFLDTGGEDGYHLRTVQELIGHRDIKTTMIYTHVLIQGLKGVRSPADTL